MLLQATVRSEIANYVAALFEVYIIIIFIYILTNIIFSIGGRVPYSRWSDALLGFLRDVCEPYLRIFRRLIPPIGMIDLTPMIAIFVLIILDRLIVGALD